MRYLIIYIKKLFFYFIFFYYICLMKENIFITTTLPYPNAEYPHVGFLFESVLADFLNRFLKSKGFNTFFNTGLDEEGLKIYQKAKSLCLTPQEYLNIVAPNYIEFCKKYHIEYDNFYRTSSERHSKRVQDVWLQLLEKGDIYKKKYYGKYCVGCESFKTDKELIENKCQYHTNIDIELVDEENYFLNLSKYKEEVLNWLNSNPIIPQIHIKELINFINEYDEISVSRLRKNCPWGTIVPNDEEHTIFIWLSALTNYFIAADDWIGWNNCDVIQLYGVDNNRFQAHIFQSILSAIGYKHSHKMLIHGTILDKNGKKMSKSEGNVIDPIEQLEKFGLDAVRYYALAGLNTCDNSAWDEEKLINQFNSEICNDWGNLVSRVLHLIDSKINGSIIDPTEEFKDFVDRFENNEIESCWEDFRIKDGLQKTNDLVKYANKYINDEKPWSLENPEQVLSNLFYLIGTVKQIYDWIFPHRKEEISEALRNKKKVILFTKIEKAKS